LSLSVPLDSSKIQQLYERIEGCLPRAAQFEGVVFRSAGVKYASKQDFLSGEGAAYFGGRWNPPRIRAIYASLDPLTATQESYQEFIKYGFKLQDIRPRVMAGARLKLACLLDLAKSTIRRKLGVTLSDLMDEHWQAIQQSGEESLTQTIGRASRAAGFEGLLVTSARNRRGKNIIIFPNQILANSVIELMSADELPPHPDLWPK
jgi:RES domain-containing protein